jgi:Flp pilus assembly protein TadG
MLMSVKPMTHHLRTRLASDEHGMAGVEFAVCASALLLLLLGLADVVPSWLAYTHVGTAAATAGDVAGRSSQMQTSDMVNVYTAAADVMQPFSATTQSMRITNVFSDGNGNAKVYWSCASGTMQPYTALSAVTSTPTGVRPNSFLFVDNVNTGVQLNGTNTSYIVTEVNYTYTPITGFVLKMPFTFNSVSYYLPRQSAYVGFPWDGNSDDSPTVPTSGTQSASVTLSNGAKCNYAK